ncbi:hypothetical protein HYW76_05325 [Candidatus Pacearchaeota archaeon]|nr:hypothetical protein [Candidatus Pacearchaeota archaeon]
MAKECSMQKDENWAENMLYVIFSFFAGLGIGAVYNMPLGGMILGIVMATGIVILRTYVLSRICK